MSGAGIVDSPVNRYEIVISFDVYFAVRTKEEENGSSGVYTQRAIAHWAFDGSGEVAGAGVGNYGTWTLTGNGNTGDTEYALRFNGDRVPYIVGPTLNDLLRTETWSTVPPF